MTFNTSIWQKQGFTSSLQVAKVSKNWRLRALNYSHSIVAGGLLDMS